MCDWTADDHGVQQSVAVKVAGIDPAAGHETEIFHTRDGRADIGVAFQRRIPVNFHWDISSMA